MAAITWRNVDGPSSRDSAATIAAGSMLANNIQQGLSGIGDVFSQIRDKKITDNNNTFLNALDQYTSPDQLQNAIQSGEVSNMLQAFKGNLDPTMRSAADTRLKAMVEAQRGTESHNLRMDQGESGLKTAELNQENQRTTNQYLGDFLKGRNAGQEDQNTISGINADAAKENAALKKAQDEANLLTYNKAEEQRNLRQKVSKRVGSAFPNLIDPETGEFDINLYQGLSPIMKAGVDKLISAEEISALSAGDTDLFRGSVNDLVTQRKISERDAAKLNLTPGAGKPTALPLQGAEAVAANQAAMIDANQKQREAEASYMFWGPKNVGDRDTFVEGRLKTRFPDGSKDRNFQISNSFINHNKDRQIELPNGEKTRIPLSVIMDTIEEEYSDATDGVTGFFTYYDRKDLDNKLNKRLKDPATIQKINESLKIRDELDVIEAEKVFNAKMSKL
jgi:hypothetical protein